MRGKELEGMKGKGLTIDDYIRKYEEEKREENKKKEEKSIEEKPKKE